VYAQPLVSQGTVLVTTEDDNIYGFNEQTGALQWSRAFARAVEVSRPQLR